MQFFGHPQARPLHGHWCGQTQHDTQTAQQAEHQQVWWVTETNVLWGEQGWRLKKTPTHLVRSTERIGKQFYYADLTLNILSWLYFQIAAYIKHLFANIIVAVLLNFCC